MPSQHLLWIGARDDESSTLQAALETELDRLIVTVAQDAHQALAVLSHNPWRILIVTVDSRVVGTEIGELVTSIKQINPAIEVVVLCHSGLSWSTLNLPRYYRPILILPPFHTDVLTSSVAKLREMVEAKEDHAYLNRVIKTRVTTSRMNIEKLLVALHGQIGIGLIRIRRDGFFISHNLEAQRLTGYPPQELTHVQSWAQSLLSSPDEVRLFLHAIEDLWAGNTDSRDLRLRVSRKDGTVITLSVKLVGIRDETGQALQVVALFFDPMEKYGIQEYDLLTNRSPFGFYTYISETGFVRVSTSALELINRAFSLNMTVQQVLGRRVKELPVPPETAAAWQEYLETTAEDRTPPADLLRPLGLPGKRILKHTFLAPVSSGLGKPVAVLAQIAPHEELWSPSFQDLPPRNLVDQRMEKVPSGLILVRAGRGATRAIEKLATLKINSTAQTILGLNHAPRTGTSLDRLFPDREAARAISERVREVVERGTDDCFELFLQERTKGAKCPLIRFWVGKVGDGAGIFFQDTSGTREAELEHRQYRLVFTHMQEGVMVTDLDGKIVNWNPASERMFGYVKDEVVGQPASMFARPAKGVQRKHGAEEVHSDETVRETEHPFVRKGGSRGLATAVFAVLRDEQGNDCGSVCLCQDLTERKRQEEKLTLAIRELEEKNLILNTLLRHAETERARACEELATDLTRRVTKAVQRIVEVKDRAHLVESYSKDLLRDLGSKETQVHLDEDHPVLTLTEKEMEVARLIRLGKTTEEISMILDKSPDTVRLQRISIRKKLGLNRRNRKLADYLKRIDFGRATA